MRKRILSLLLMVCVVMSSIMAVPITANAISAGEYVTVTVWLGSPRNIFHYSCIGLGFDTTKFEVVSGNDYGEGICDESDYRRDEGCITWVLESGDKYLRARDPVMTVTFKAKKSTPNIYSFFVNKDHTALFYWWGNNEFAEYPYNWIKIDVKQSSYVPTTNVSLNSTSLTLKNGEMRRLQVTYLPSNATDKRITWSSSNNSVATVNNNGVVTAKGLGNATIYARSINGKTASCIVNVKKIVDYDDFKYKISNWAVPFGYPHHWEGGNCIADYKIPQERYIQIGYSDKKAKKTVEKNDNWGGNCFGLSASSILFYKDVLTEQRYDANVLTPSGFGDSISETKHKKLRDMIEVFQIAQDLNPKQPKFSCSAVVAELEKGNPVKFGLKASGGKGKHAVVIYNYSIDNNGVYIFDIYDCSNFVTHFLYKSDNAWKFIYNDEKYEWSPNNYCTYDTLKSLYNEIRNKKSDNSVTLFSLEEEPTYTHIFTPAGDYTITNSQGQVSTITDAEISGELADINVIPSSYLAENPIYTIIAPTDTYTIVGSGDEVVTTSLADDYMSVDITAKSSTPITVSADLKEISVEAIDGEEYSIKYTTYDNTFDEMMLSGIATGKVSAKLDGAEVTVTGIDTLNATATVSESEVVASAEELSESGDITVKCEDTDSGATIQILSVDSELTEKAALPERLAVDAPVYDLESGEYTEAQTLTFTKDDETIIYYTIDGSVPSADNGIIYTMPIDINKSVTIKAISTKYGYSDSEVIELSYTLPEVSLPVADKSSGEYDEVITVGLYADSYEDSIYYTMDGSDPIENGILYTVPINLSEDTTLKAYTVDSNGCISEVCEYEYVVRPAQTFYFSNSFVNQDNEVITAENIADISEIKLTVTKFKEGEQSGVFMVAFYDSEGRLICLKKQGATINEELGEVVIEIDEDVSSTKKIKAFVWNDTNDQKPLGNVMTEEVAVTTEE